MSRPQLSDMARQLERADGAAGPRRRGWLLGPLPGGLAR
eukprot:SAG31_NODE_491_length_14923_cov_12.905221_1_plen_38_part_10